MCDGWSRVNNVEIADTTQSGHQHQHMNSNRGVFFFRKNNQAKDSVGFRTVVVLVLRSAGNTAMLHLMIFMGRIKTGRRIKCRYRYEELHTDPRPATGEPDPSINYNYPTLKP